MFSNRKRTHDNLVELCRNGSLFDSRQYIMNNARKDRKKLLIFYEFEGYLFIHSCHICKQWNPIPNTIVRIAHFRKIVYSKYHTEHYTKLLQYSVPLKKEIQYITN